MKEIHHCGDGCLPQHPPAANEEVHGSLVLRKNDDGTIDEIITDPALRPVMLHIEQMDDDQWWMGICEYDHSPGHPIRHHHAVRLGRKKKLVILSYDDEGE